MVYSSDADNSLRIWRLELLEQATVGKNFANLIALALYCAVQIRFLSVLLRRSLCLNLATKFFSVISTQNVNARFLKYLAQV